MTQYRRILTFLILLLEVSVMYTLSDASTATPHGLYSNAPVAGPPSSILPELPVPAIVFIIPVDIVTYVYMYSA